MSLRKELIRNIDEVLISLSSDEIDENDFNELRSKFARYLLALFIDCYKSFSDNSHEELLSIFMDRKKCSEWQEKNKVRVFEAQKLEQDNKLDIYHNILINLEYKRRRKVIGYFNKISQVISVKSELNSYSIDNRNDFYNKLIEFIPVLVHERFHLLASIGRIKYDLPFASAIEYVIRTYLKSFRSNKYFNRNFFKNKLYSFNINRRNRDEILSIISIYNENSEEDEKSYRDGYRLGKIIFEVTNFNLFTSMYIIETLSMNYEMTKNNILTYALDLCLKHKKKISESTFSRILGPQQISEQFYYNCSQTRNLTDELYTSIHNSFIHNIELFSISLKQAFPRYWYLDFIFVHAVVLNKDKRDFIANMINTEVINIFKNHGLDIHLNQLNFYREKYAELDGYFWGKSIFKNVSSINESMEVAKTYIPHEEYLVENTKRLKKIIEIMNTNNK